MTALAARDAYRLWAPTYSSENVVTTLEQELVSAITPALAGLRLLDAGCGTGRRLRAAGPAVAVGVDISDAMIAEALREDLPANVRLAVGDIRALDLPDRSFDIVWCRLVIGHLPDCGAVYSELARVADAGATIIVSDFHPAAHEAGHRRTFRAGGEVHEVEHHVHDPAQQLAAAADSGLELVAIREAAVGEGVRPKYQAAGRAEAYDRDLGLPLVLALAFRRPR